MLKTIKEVIEANSDIEFVIHCKTENETKELINVLTDMEYEYTIPLDTLPNMAKNFAETDGWDGCWRISSTRGIAYNQSLSHWTELGYEYVDMENYLN